MRVCVRVCVRVCSCACVRLRTLVRASISTECAGFVHRGLCLQSSVVQNGVDSPPSSCIPYQPIPDLGWELQDYMTICAHFSGSFACQSVNYAYSQGGRCSGHTAILSFSPISGTSVWAHRDVFNWSPSHRSPPNCRFQVTQRTTAVYVCAFAEEVMTNGSVSK